MFRGSRRQVGQRSGSQATPFSVQEGVFSPLFLPLQETEIRKLERERNLFSLTRKKQTLAWVHGFLWGGAWTGCAQPPSPARLQDHRETHLASATEALACPVQQGCCKPVRSVWTQLRCIIIHYNKLVPKPPSLHNLEETDHLMKIKCSNYS